MDQVLKENQKPLVLDADGLNLLAKNHSLMANKKYPVIVTPHIGEMARLTGKEISVIKENSIETALEFSKKQQAVCVLKDARTIVTWGDRGFYVNSSGNHGMATAGSGDVLTGMIGAFLGQGLDPKESARLGVYLHGCAGDRAAKLLGKPAVMASDIIDFIGQVMI